MVDLGAGINLLDLGFVGDDMRVLGAIKLKSPIPIRVDIGRPYPTRTEVRSVFRDRPILINFDPESILPRPFLTHAFPPGSA
jgi:hypothetical protein